MLLGMLRKIILLALLLPSLLYAAEDNLQQAVEAMQMGAYRDAHGQLVRLSEEGNRDAQTLLGIIYNEGLGVTQDLQQARYWYKRAAEKGKVDAAFLLGLSYLNNYSAEKGLRSENDSKAAYWIKYAARHDNISAQRFMAIAYEKGWMNIPVSELKSTYWWDRYEKLSAARSSQKNTLSDVALASSVQSTASRQRQSLHDRQRD